MQIDDIRNVVSIIVPIIISHAEPKKMLILVLSFFLVILGLVSNIRESYIPYFGIPKRFQKYFDEIDY